MILETADFVSGKKTKRGKRLPVEPETVTVVTAENRADLERATCRFLGCPPADLRGELQELRDLGFLVHDDYRLTKRIRFRDPDARYGVEHRRCYVFRGSREEVPVRPVRPQVSVIWWS